MSAFAMPDLAERHLQPELMDQPGLAASAHRQALLGLERVNRISRVAATLWPPLAELAAELERPLKVLDLACGGGDVALGLERRARRARVPVEIAACDSSPVAIEHARARAEARRSAVSYFRSDLLREGVPEGYDALVSSLFLHHLDAPRAERLLTEMARSGARLVAVSDLLRSRLGYFMAWIGPHLLTRSPIARADGPLSVRAAFTPAELLALATRAGLAHATIRRVWPQRFLLTWIR